MSSADAPLTLGTAGHIDHGKTALIGALTGRETDRLPEERERGISIELGYAPLELPSGRRLSVVDVPGPRAVRAHDGRGRDRDRPLPSVRRGGRRRDGADARARRGPAAARRGARGGRDHEGGPGRPGRAIAELADSLPGRAAGAVSARTGEGLDELLAALDDVAAGVLRARSVGEGEPRLHVDRSFSLQGDRDGRDRDAVVRLARSRRSRGRASAGLEARVRSVEVHDEQVERGGGRAAGRAEPRGRRARRGRVVGMSSPRRRPACGRRGSWTPASGSRTASRLERGTRVHVHHGTRETPARVVPIEGTDLVQLRLESQLVPAAGDRLVLRQVAPPDTIGGGEVVDPRPRKHSRLPRTRSAAAGDRSALRRLSLADPSRSASVRSSSPRCSSRTGSSHARTASWR